ncbi:hypothetical protein AGMMS49944_28100 [Spirochaetia bacterium]|nr:hypothetical protein AGMMS49944_28100 [Spirochaetia bacterium]
MKHFVIQIIKFMSILAVLLIILISGTLLIVSKGSFKLPQDKDIVVVGDSHTECAIDDAIFSRSVNISKSGTAYLYSYVKLKKILNENDHIDTVLLSFIDGILDKEMDRWIQDNNRIYGFIPIYFFLLNKEDYFVFKDNSAFIMSILDIPVKNVRAIFKYIMTRNISYKDLHIGAYQKLDRDKLQADISSQENNSVPADIQEEYSQYQLDYLLKIVNLCKEKNVELILFKSPTYKPEKYGSGEQLLYYYNKYLEGVKFIDFSGYPMPDYGYGDIGHLNYKGAEIFSNFLNENYDEIISNIK